MSEDSREIRTMRNMAWARAKGELDSMLSSYWGDDGTENFNRMQALIKEFTETVESEGVHE